jgi:hypothetical protein
MTQRIRAKVSLMQWEFETNVQKTMNDIKTKKPHTLAGLLGLN